MKLIRAIAVALVLSGVTVTVLAVLVGLERSAVEMSSYSKLVELEKRGFLRVPVEDELSFGAPSGDLSALHQQLFRMNESTRWAMWLLTALGLITTILSAVTLGIARRPTAVTPPAAEEMNVNL